MRKPIALLLSVLLLMGTVFITPASAYSSPVTVKQLEQTAAEINKGGYGNVDVIINLGVENGIGSGMFNVYYDVDDYAFDTAYGYDEELYNVTAKDDKGDEAVKVAFLSLKANCEEELTIKLSFLRLTEDADPEYGFDPEIIELVDGDAKELGLGDSFEFDMDLEYDTDSEKKNDEIKLVSIDYTCEAEYEKGIGGAVWEVYYPWEIATPYSLSGYDADVYSVIAHDDYAGTLTLSALALTDQYDKELTIVVSFMVNDSENPEFDSQLLELFDPEGHGESDSDTSDTDTESETDSITDTDEPDTDTESETDSITDTDEPDTDSMTDEDKPDSETDTTNYEFGSKDVTYEIKYDKGIGGAMFEIYYEPGIYTLTAVKGFNAEKYNVVVFDDYQGTARVNALAVTDQYDDELSVTLVFKLEEENGEAKFYSHCIELVDAEGNVVPECKTFGHLIDGDETDIDSSFDNTTSDSDLQSDISYGDTDIYFIVDHPDLIGGVLFEVLYPDNYEFVSVTGYDTDNYMAVINDDRLGAVKINVICSGDADETIKFDIHFKQVRSSNASASSGSGFVVRLLELVTFNAEVVYTNVEDYVSVENEDVELVIDVGEPAQSDSEVETNEDSESDSESEVDTDSSKTLHDTDIIYTIEHEKGIGGALFEVCYNFTLSDPVFEYVSISGYDSDKYQTVVVDDKTEDTVRVNVINATDSPDTKVTFVLHFKALKEYDSIDGLFYAKLIELVTFDAENIEDPDYYGKIDSDLLPDTDDTDNTDNTDNTDSTDTTDSNADTDTGIPIDTESNADSNADTDSGIPIDTDSNADSNADTDTGIPIDTDSNGDTDTDNTDTSNDNDRETSDTDDTDSKNTVTILVGDVNKDEKITARDSLLAQRYVIKLTSLDELAALAADVNNDGKVDNRDCLDILRYSIGVAVKSDVGEYREVTLTGDTDTSSPDISDTDTKDTETDIETSGNDAVFNIKYDKGIGGALFFIYYNDDLFEFDSITFKTDNNDSDMFVITANDDKLGTVKVNAINQTDYPAKWVSFVLHFKPIDPNNKESASFTATFEELVSYDAKVVENPDNYGGLNFRIS